MGAALVFGKMYQALDKDMDRRAMRLCNSARATTRFNFENTVKKIYEQTGQPIGPLPTCALKIFGEQSFFDNYNIAAFNSKGQRFFFRDACSDQSINILLADGHYYWIKSILAFLCAKFYCQRCGKAHSRRWVQLGKSRISHVEKNSFLEDTDAQKPLVPGVNKECAKMLRWKIS